MTLSASGLSRAAQCLFWVVSPPEEEPEAGPKAELGTDCHAVCEDVLRGLEVDFSSLDPEVRARTEPLLPELHRLSELHAEAEVPLALHVLRGSARRLHSNGHRDYSDLRMNEIPLTIDLRWLEEDTLVVQDWKTGRPEFVDQVGDNAQMIAGGAAAYLELQEPVKAQPLAMTQREGVDRVNRRLSWSGTRPVNINYVRLQIAFISETGGLRIESETFDASDLVALAMRTFQPIMRRLAEHSMPTATTKPITPVTGPKCRWCPSIGHCPAAEALAESAHGGDSLVAPGDTAHRFVAVVGGEAHAAFLRSAVKLVEDYCKTVNASLREWVRVHGEIDLGNGQSWREVRCKTETVNLGGAVAGLISPSELDKVSPRKAPTTTAITKALGAKRSKEIISHARELGAVEEREYSQFRTAKQKRKS